MASHSLTKHSAVEPKIALRSRAARISRANPNLLARRTTASTGKLRVVVARRCGPGADIHAAVMTKFGHVDAVRVVEPIRRIAELIVGDTKALAIRRIDAVKEFVAGADGLRDPELIGRLPQAGLRIEDCADATAKPATNAARPIRAQIETDARRRVARDSSADGILIATWRRGKLGYQCGVGGRCRQKRKLVRHDTG